MTYSAENLPKNKHCFFGSEGGVSEGVYASLNTNNYSLDKKENVDKNFEIIANKSGLKSKDILLQNQGFSNIVNFTEEASIYKLTGDGIVTNKPNILLCIRTADCAPILFADYKNGIIGASHAGWRSALRGVVENTLDLMIEKGADRKNIVAAIGPCLLKQSFEAGQDMVDEFSKQNENFKQYFEPFNGKYLFDLEQFCFDKVKNYGIDNISKSNINTYTDKNFFSFRRSGHSGEIKQAGDFPTQLSTIML